MPPKGRPQVAGSLCSPRRRPPPAVCCALQAVAGLGPRGGDSEGFNSTTGRASTVTKPRDARLIRLGMPVVAVLFALFVSEVALRAIRFEFRFVPTVQFGYHDPTTLVNRYFYDSYSCWITT